ncbi:hypothetical protein KCV87_04440 [Actinosynnema pretiosum subsp. pretiosum]|uniref:Secreted protein n=2 Tax=Actinosynnema TaxID=40566 RepID=C6W7Z8_ACTMD|nr:hypothetical protein [Actinosynnema mirum]ACU37019.1 hypothetical protein Amir_3105 [Actinosynnema mirum DSM 43827]AXX30502.1 hypothetical protein APASM_3137 [Actinosynnema pretiosum subsp. pretiosum]QUF05358.1 hypothetical protein KCV87_04440 [Actinosynnema pretiosum subsp. pretiosum]
MTRKHVLRTLASTTATAGVLTALAVVAPAVASARCGGASEIRSTLVVDGAVVLAERPVPGTCNGNGYYQGQVQSKVDGWRPSVWVHDGTSWTGHFGDYDGTSANYSYTDEDSTSRMHFCLDWKDIAVYCGWGTEWSQNNAGIYYHGDYGVNHGF